jgi:hypothetical protein
MSTPNTLAPKRRGLLRFARSLKNALGMCGLLGQRSKRNMVGMDGYGGYSVFENVFP